MQPITLQHFHLIQSTDMFTRLNPKYLELSKTHIKNIYFVRGFNLFIVEVA